MHAITLEKMTYGIEALGRIDGKVVFVPYGAPQDKVSIEITEDKKDFARARITKITTPSPSRRKSPCPNFPACGGCHWLHLAPETQRREKEAYLRFLLTPLAPKRVYPIEALGEFRYRNKIDLKPSMGADGDLKLGNFRIHSHDVVDMAGCRVQVPENMEMYATLKKFLPKALTPEEIGQIERVSCRTLGGQQQVVVNFTQPPSAKVLDAWRGFFAANEQVTQLETEGPGDGLALLREAEPFKLCNQTWAVSPRSFFQGNVEGAEAIYYTLQSLYEGREKGGKLLDLYSGVGVQTLLIDKLFDEVLAVESNESSYQDAIRNQKIRYRSKVRFICRKVEAVVGTPLTKGSIAAVHVNPPRSGMPSRVIRGISALKPRLITYLSCHPLTFKRDAATLISTGYQLEQVYSFDLFPNTYHLEVLGVFVR